MPPSAFYGRCPYTSVPKIGARRTMACHRAPQKACRPARHYSRSVLQHPDADLATESSEDFHEGGELNVRFAFFHA